MPDLTTDPADPRLGHGQDNKPVPQQEAYLILSEEERAKGFVRPVRRSYKHVGAPGPKYSLSDLTDEQKALWGDEYAKFEAYPEGSNAIGKFWTQAQLDNIRKGCGTVTTMGDAFAETYAREPRFYGATYCVVCSMHKPVNEFIWIDDGTEVGT